MLVVAIVVAVARAFKNYSTRYGKF